MAEITGAAAYKELKRDTNYTTPIIEKGTDRLAAKFKEERGIRAAKGAADRLRVGKAKAAEKVERNKIKPSTLGIKPTGHFTYDKIFRDFTLKAIEKDSEYARAARETLGDKDFYLDKRANLTSIFKIFNANADIIKENFEANKKLFREDKIYGGPTLEFANAMEQRDFSIFLGNNDEVIIKAMIRDKNGEIIIGKDGEPKTEVRTLEELLDSKQTFVRKITIDKFVENGVKLIGSKDNVTIGAKYIATKNNWETTNGNKKAGDIWDAMPLEQKIAFHKETTDELLDKTEIGKHYKTDKALYTNLLKNAYDNKKRVSNVGGGGKETEKEKEYNLFVKRFQKADNLVSNILAKVEGKLPGFTDKESVKKFILKYYDTNNLTLDPKDIEDAVNGIFFWKEKSNNSVKIGGERIELTRESRAEIVKSLVYLEYVPGEFSNADSLYARMVNVKTDRKNFTQQKFNKNQEKKGENTSESDTKSDTKKVLEGIKKKLEKDKNNYFSKINQR